MPVDPRSPAAVLAALGEPTRVRIARVLSAGEAIVTTVATALNVEMVNISHHLGVLRSAGVVEHRKDGRFVWYSLAEAEVSAGEVTFRRPGVTVTLDR